MPFAGVPEFDAALKRIVTAAEKATGDAVMTGAHLVEGATKVRASGRPGPRVVSGSHRRSVHVEGPKTAGTQVSAQIGPSMIYSRRLELGFTGSDAIGRSYHTAAFPSLTPGLADTMPQLEQVFVRAWLGAIETA
jgi:hypothetical protein